MSVRRTQPSGVPAHVTQLQKELADLKSSTAATAAPVDTLQAPSADGSVTFDSLSENEKSAASLGVHPESWKPIAFMNNGHYDTLMKTNALDGDLARRIEVRLPPPPPPPPPPCTLTVSLSCLTQAFKTVAEASK